MRAEIAGARWGIAVYPESVVFSSQTSATRVCLLSQIDAARYLETWTETALVAGYPKSH